MYCWSLQHTLEIYTGLCATTLAGQELCIPLGDILVMGFYLLLHHRHMSVRSWGSHRSRCSRYDVGVGEEIVTVYVESGPRRFVFAQLTFTSDLIHCPRPCFALVYSIFVRTYFAKTTLTTASDISFLNQRQHGGGTGAPRAHGHAQEVISSYHSSIQELTSPQLARIWRLLRLFHHLRNRRI
jgi:hypothetical protein